MNKRKPKKYQVSKWKIDHPFVGLELMLKAVIRFTQKDFPEKTPQERFHKIMNLLFKEEKIPQERGPKRLGFKDGDMNDWKFYLLIAEERVKYFKEHGKELPMEHAIEKNIDLVVTHAADKKNTIRNWRAAYSSFEGELEDEEKISQARKAIEFTEQHLPNSEKMLEEMFQLDRQNVCRDWKSSVREINRFLRKQGWPI